MGAGASVLASVAVSAAAVVDSCRAGAAPVVAEAVAVVSFAQLSACDAAIFCG